MSNEDEIKGEKQALTQAVSGHVEPVVSCGSYIIFGGSEYYAHGGANDLLWIGKGSLDEVIAKAISMVGANAFTYIAAEEDRGWDEDCSHEIEWVHVMDAITGIKMYNNQVKPCGDSTILKVEPN